MSSLLASLGHTGRRRVGSGHTSNTLQHVLTKKSHHVLSKFMIFCWASFTAILGCMRPVGHRLDTPTLDGLQSQKAMGGRGRTPDQTGLWPQREWGKFLRCQPRGTVPGILKVQASHPQSMGYVGLRVRQTSVSSDSNFTICVTLGRSL